MCRVEGWYGHKGCPVLCADCPLKILEGAIHKITVYFYIYYDQSL